MVLFVTVPIRSRRLAGFDCSFSRLRNYNEWLISRLCVRDTVSSALWQKERDDICRFSIGVHACRPCNSVAHQGFMTVSNKSVALRYKFEASRRSVKKSNNFPGFLSMEIINRPRRMLSSTKQATTTRTMTPQV